MSCKKDQVGGSPCRWQRTYKRPGIPGQGVGSGFSSWKVPGKNRFSLSEVSRGPGGSLAGVSTAMSGRYAMGGLHLAHQGLGSGGGSVQSVQGPS